MHEGQAGFRVTRDRARQRVNVHMLTVWDDGLWVKLWDMGMKGRMWRVIKKHLEVPHC